MLSCLGPAVWELSRASPACLRWMFPGSSAAVFFPGACLAERSHLAEGERGDVRNRALSSRGSRPTSGSLRLPWQTALATWLLEPLFLVPTSSREVWYPEHWGGPCLGSSTPKTTGSSVLLVIPGRSHCSGKRLRAHPAQPAEESSWVWHSRPQMPVHPSVNIFLS